MISVTELLLKAEKAAYNYRKVYGEFPKKIGIHRERLATFRSNEFQQVLIAFNSPVVSGLPLTNESVLPDAASQHVMSYEPVAGEGISWDEVYLPVPGDEMNVTSGERIAHMAEEQKMGGNYAT